MTLTNPDMKIRALAPWLILNTSAERLPLADESVHCVVTSPPYWGLRAYGTNPRVWGGTAECRHEWGATGSKHRGGPQGATRQRADRDTSAQDVVGTISTGQFCQHCNAWRGEYGSDPTPELYVAHTVEIFREVRRVLRADGTLWLNIGDCYATGAGKVGTEGGGGKQGRAFREKYYGKHAAIGLPSMTQPNRMPIEGLKPKDQVFIPHRVAIALQADGWWVRDTIIWHKPNPMPSSVTDRTTGAHEYVFLLTKSARYFYDADAIREPVTSTGGASFGSVKKKDDGVAKGPNLRGIRRLEDDAQRNHPLGRNKRSVWTIPTESFHGAHFATFPKRLVEPCILAGTSEKGCCPHCGAGWKRVTERTTEFRSGSGKAGNPPSGKGRPTGDGQVRSNHDLRMGNTPRVVTTHWLPSCKCPSHDPAPCVVFDPFSGAATTGVVAHRLGRRYIGTELNPEYALMGHQRIANDAGPKVKRQRLNTAPEIVQKLFEWQANAEATP